LSPNSSFLFRKIKLSAEFKYFGPSLRGLEIFLEEGMSVKLIRMPEGLDPDDYLAKHGAEPFQQLLNNAQDFFDYKLEILLQRYDAKSATGIVKITNDFLETLSKIKNTILLDYYLKRLAHAIQLDQDSLRVELLKLKKKDWKQEGEKDFLKQSAKAITISEEILILSLIQENESFLCQAIENLNEYDFRDPVIRDYFCQLKQNVNQEGVVASYPKIHHVRDENLKMELAAAMAIEWDQDIKEKAFEDCLRKLKVKRVEKRLKEIRQLEKKS